MIVIKDVHGRFFSGYSEEGFPNFHFEQARIFDNVHDKIFIEDVLSDVNIEWKIKCYAYDTLMSKSSAFPSPIVKNGE